MSSRHDISDDDWNRIAPFLLGQAGGHGGVGFATRLFVNAIISIAVTGIAWADRRLCCYVKSNSVWQHYDRWCRIGVWQKVAAELRDGDTEWLCVDSSCVRATGATAGAKKSGREWWSGVRGVGAWLRRIRHQDPRCHQLPWPSRCDRTDRGLAGC